MKNIRSIGYALLVAAIAMAVAGCNCCKKGAEGEGEAKTDDKPAVVTPAEHHAEHPAEKPAGEKPLDHPAH